MKNITKVIAFLLLIGTMLFTNSCGKYDEGPNFSLASKKSRMSQKWALESTITAGGATVNCNNCWYFDLSASAVASDNYAYANLKWQFSNDKEKLELVASAGAGSGSNSANASVAYSFNILRLTGKELWIKDPVTGIEFHFRAQ